MCFTCLITDHNMKYDVFQREMMGATEKLNPLLGKHQRGASWRVDPEIYRPATMTAPQGLLNLSPAWFQQGHEVSHFGS
jgi:hypothetical protein